jgi:predicted RND superfamily exporter protein
VPSEETQRANFGTWNSFRKENSLFSGNASRVFLPFQGKLKNPTIFAPIPFLPPPEFISHLVKEDKALTMWFVETPVQEKKLKGTVSGVESLFEIVTNFTSLLSREISIFLPLSVVGILVLLLARYRNVKKAGLCLIPFLFSLGLISVVYSLLSVPLTFMSLLGLILIYGLSVDYGIFTTDFYSSDKRDVERHSSLNLSLLVNWGSGIVGFLPLVFCRHPILHDLGLVLTLGMIGVFYSSFYFMPALFSWRGKT